MLARLLADRFPEADHPPVPRPLQVDVLHRLVFAKEDTILIAKTGFGKSLIFQALALMTERLSIVVVPLLGLADQIFDEISCIPGVKPIVLSKERKGQHDDIFKTILGVTIHTLS